MHTGRRLENAVGVHRAQTSKHEEVVVMMEGEKITTSPLIDDRPIYRHLYVLMILLVLAFVVIVIIEFRDTTVSVCSHYKQNSRGGSGIAENNRLSLLLVCCWCAVGAPLTVYTST